MAVLAQPYEIVEWDDGQSRDFTIERYELGELEIHPRDGRPSKVVQVMRIHLPTEQKPDFPHYWDVTSQRLVAALRGLLPATLIQPLKVRVTAIGVAPRTHFTVSRLPERPE